ncbi:MAG: iron-sulfur cluster assembly scaffold protein [Candidatus Lokiarchaeota archaeon]|nr:iron-sulfur cluster assembly scaffold protein [Candidatus Lokiarchaeota archaeon]
MVKNESNEFDEFVKQLQAEIDNEEEKEFSKAVLEEYRNPSNVGVISNPNAEAKYKGPCGDTMHFTLKIQNNVIEDIKFVTDGCGPSIACGSKLTKMVKNLPIEKALSIKPEDLVKELEWLPPDHEHCALLAIRTLNKAFNKEI